MHSLFLGCFVLLVVAVVNAGPGTHQYSYGDDKKHREYHMNEIQQKQMVDQTPELTVHYLFAIHDINDDGYLDGHELIAAFEEQDEMLSLEEVTEMVDHILLEDDKNGDGVISWTEYLHSHQGTEKNK